MLDHRMAGKAELAHRAHADRSRLDAGELDSLRQFELLGAIEAREKIEVPPRAAELAVGDRLQADVFLLADERGDLAVLDRFSASALILPPTQSPARASLTGALRNRLPT